MRKRRTKRHWHPLHVMGRCLSAALLGTAALAALLIWWISANPLRLGPELRAHVARALEPALAAQGLSLSFEVLAVQIKPGGRPALLAEGVRLSRSGGDGAISVAEAQLLLDRSDLLAGHIRPDAIKIAGMEIDVQRDQNDGVTVQAGPTVLLPRIDRPGALIKELNALFERPALSELRSLTIDRASLRLTDIATGTVVQSPESTLQLLRNPDRVRLIASLSGFGSDTAPGSARVELISSAQGDAELRVALRGVVPADLDGIQALNARADLLKRFDAPLSVDLVGGLTTEGTLGELTGQLNVGSGMLYLTAPLPSIELTTASAQIIASEQGRRIDLEGLTIETSHISLRGHGALLAPKPADDSPTEEILAQLDLRDIRLDRMKRLPGAVRLEHVATDARIQLDGAALRLDLQSQIQTSGDIIDVALSTRGPGALNDPGRSLSVDVTSARVAKETVFKLWPLDAFPRTRTWLDTNILGGTMRNVALAVRAPGGGRRVQTALNFGFENADIRFLKTLAPLTGARGRATLYQDEFRLALDRASLTPEGAPTAQLAPSVMVIPDVTRRPGLLQLDLDLRAPVASLLSVLAKPPFKNDPDSPDLISPLDSFGDTDLRAQLEIPLGPDGGMKAATFDITGTVTDFANETLLEGKRLTAREIAVAATQEHIGLSGATEIDGQPVTISFERVLPGAPDGPGPPQFSASGPLTAALAEVFGVNLPTALTARGAGQFEAEFEIAPDAPPRLRLDADLTGLALSAPAIGLRKSAAQGGTVGLSVALGPERRVEALRVDMPGLVADIGLDLAPGGGLEQARADRLQLGGWLTSAGQYRPATSRGRAQLFVNGGRLDLRRMPDLGRGGQSTGRGAPDLSAALDRVTISDGLRLTDLRIDLPGATGSTGTLRARVNGRAPVRARVVRQRNGLAVSVKSDDAGALLAAANLFSNGRGGELELRLVPLGPPGEYAGQLIVTDASLQGAGTAASILSALSIVGAIDQMQGDGIVFTKIGARFRLTRGRLILDSAFAEGPSLGMSLDGTVDLANQNLSLQGAVSPVHFLNQFGGPRRGEGLIGASFRVSGTTRSPDVRMIPLSLLTPGFLRDMFRQPVAPGN